jgi:DNA-binding MarR family transcriptional regulator
VPLWPLLRRRSILDGVPAVDPIASAREIWMANGWAQAARGMAAITSVMRAHQLFLARANEALRPFDLTFPRYEVLAWLVWQTDDGSLSLKELSELSQVTPATITKAVDRLERAGLIDRVPHPTDARTTLARITRRGRRVVAQSTEALNAQVFEAVDLTPEEMDHLFRLLLQARVGAGDVVAGVDDAVEAH